MRSRRFFNDLAEELRELPEEVRIIAIDGRCAAGKTTLAARLVKELGGDVIHMDDFFLPPALRTPERRSEPGGNVHYERFLTEVLPNLRSGRPFFYRRFDCSRMTLGEEIPVENNGYVFVEGAYSCHPVFGDYMDRRVFLDIDGKTHRKSGSASGMARTDYRTFYSCGSLWKRHTFRHSLCGKKQITSYYDARVKRSKPT